MLPILNFFLSLIFDLSVKIGEPNEYFNLNNFKMFDSCLFIDKINFEIALLKPGILSKLRIPDVFSCCL